MEAPDAISTCGDLQYRDVVRRSEGRSSSGRVASLVLAHVGALVALVRELRARVETRVEHRMKPPTGDNGVVLSRIRQRLQKSRPARWWNAPGILVGGTVRVGVASYLLVLAGGSAASMISCFAFARLAGAMMIADFRDCSTALDSVLDRAQHRQRRGPQATDGVMGRPERRARRAGVHPSASCAVPMPRSCQSLDATCVDGLRRSPATPPIQSFPREPSRTADSTPPT